MGVVYRARDTKLQREVAIKVLPELLASDPERLARFRREAQTLAALNHPNIAQIHGLEETDAVHALVMELVEGEDLAQRIARGALPLDEAVAIARQIADALDTAHESGIVHRDLKPANVRLRTDGTVKVLDFGLAKALEPTTTSSGGASALANSPTLTQHATQLGVILGSAAYMAPEQARGRAVDRRADIWAFGVVLYELLTGRRCFEGEETTDVLASVLKSDPDFAALPPETPAALHRLLRRCLEKDPRRRLSSIRDARLELDEKEPPAGPAAAVAQPARASRVARSVPFLAGAAIAGILTVVAMRLLSPSQATGPGGGLVTRLSILAPPGKSLFPDTSGVAISPDGRRVAFLVGSVIGADTELWVRDLASPISRRIEGGDGAQYLFWAPDSQRLGFGTTAQLKVVGVQGGRAQVLGEVDGIRGGAWNRADQILYAPNVEAPLLRISANGGDPVAVTTLDAARGESSHRFPVFLPGGDRFLFATLPARNGRFEVFASSLSDPSKRIAVGSFESAPQWIETGWLLFARRGVLAAQRFDPEALKLEGEAFPLEDEPTAIWDPAFSVTAAFASGASQVGSLAYFASGSIATRAAWIEESGRETGALQLPRGQYSNVSISPDGTQAIFVRSISATESTLWLADLQRKDATPLATGGGRNESPVWSPDGRRIVFASDRDGPQNLYEIGITEPSPERPFYSSPVLFKNPDAWSPDGAWITLQHLDPVGKQNIWLIPASGNGQAEVYAQGPTRELNSAVSPDGRWMAFAAEDTGRFEIYIQSFPKPGRRVQVSRDGGLRSWWSPDGRELTWVTEANPTLWRAGLENAPPSGGVPRFGEPRKLATLPPGARGGDAMPDRHRFLVLLAENADPGSIVVVQNWPATLPGGR